VNKQNSIESATSMNELKILYCAGNELIDYIKIDRAFVQNLSDNQDDQALCEAIIVMANKLGIKVIAEGIELQDQQQLLFEAGCEYGQGYLFSKPVPEDEFEKLMNVAYCK
jgi:EAL domain-containing protein (putative c-di-GMP-specific phosphodiesterase class I)